MQIMWCPLVKSIDLLILLEADAHLLCTLFSGIPVFDSKIVTLKLSLQNLDIDIKLLKIYCVLVFLHFGNCRRIETCRRLIRLLIKGQL